MPQVFILWAYAAVWGERRVVAERRRELPRLMRRLPLALAVLLPALIFALVIALVVARRAM